MRHLNLPTSMFFILLLHSALFSQSFTLQISSPPAEVEESTIYTLSVKVKSVSNFNGPIFLTTLKSKFSGSINLSTNQFSSPYKDSCIIQFKASNTDIGFASFNVIGANGVITDTIKVQLNVVPNTTLIDTWKVIKFSDLPANTFLVPNKFKRVIFNPGNKIFLIMNDSIVATKITSQITSDFQSAGSKDIWIAQYPNKVFNYNGTYWDEHPLPTMFRGRINRLLVDLNDKVHVLSDSGSYAYLENNVWTLVNLPDPAIYNFDTDQNGVPWFVSKENLYVYNKTEFSRIAIPQIKYYTGLISTQSGLLIDDSGNVIVTHNSNNYNRQIDSTYLYVVDKNKLSLLKKINISGLVNWRYIKGAYGSIDKSLWLAYAAYSPGSSIPPSILPCEIKNNMFYIHSPDVSPLPQSWYPCSMVQDNKNRFWFTSCINGGVYGIYTPPVLTNGTSLQTDIISSVDFENKQPGLLINNDKLVLHVTPIGTQRNCYVYDYLGREYGTFIIESGNSDVTLDLSDYPNGIYNIYFNNITQTVLISK